MDLTEEEIIQKYAKHCSHCERDTLLPYEYEYMCISFGYNVIKGKHELFKIQRKKIHFINQLRYAEHRIFCFCIKVHQIYEG